VDRELTYQMPFERLTKLSRSMSRKASSTSWLVLWTLFAAYIAALIAIIVFDDTVMSWQHALRLPPYSAFVLIVLLFVIAVWALRRHGRQLIKGRANFDDAVRFRKDEGGLRFASSQIEYYVKWQGISQMLMDRDGVAISHGGLFFLIPDSAFVDLSERNALVRDVFGRMGPAARSRSEKHIRPALDASAGMA
jgi:hypothetical protein